MSPTRELWILVRNTLLADTAITTLVNAIYDKVPDSPWGEKNAYISRGPSFGVDDGADCIDGQEITLQLDVWSKVNNTGTCNDIVEAVRKAVHEKELELTENALVQTRVELWRVIDDPDPLVTHGIIQIVALIEVPEVS
jgi:hypothetical protein